ncbi:MAG: hypothetical protein HZC28_04200 [Spirochaetes bacterium]|nr:hypothetical protein [Spirochaetota bacterium]
MAAYINAYSIITPEHRDAASLKQAILHVRIPERFAIAPEVYTGFRSDAELDVSYDETAVLAVTLVNDLAQRAGISSKDLRDIPVIIANSKGGVRSFERLFTAFMHSGDVDGSFASVPPYHAGSVLAGHFGITAPVISVQSACASGITALIAGTRMLERGYERVIVIAVESSSTGIMHAGFDALDVLTPETVMRPFAENRGGFIMSEGGAAVLLSREQQRAYAEVERIVEAADASHYIRFRADGSTIQNAMKRLAYSRNDIDAVIAHGTATENDIIEANAAHSVWGDVPVTGLKTYLGHSLGANALIEITACIDLAREGYIAHLPASLPVAHDIRANIITAPVRHEVRRFVKLAYGFGGCIALAGIRILNGAAD